MYESGTPHPATPNETELIRSSRRFHAKLSKIKQCSGFKNVNWSLETQFTMTCINVCGLERSRVQKSLTEEMSNRDTWLPEAVWHKPSMSATVKLDSNFVSTGNTWTWIDEVWELNTTASLTQVLVGDFPRIDNHSFVALLQHLLHGADCGSHKIVGITTRGVAVKSRLEVG